MKLYEIAHSRAGDKGNLSILSVIAYKKSDYETVRTKVTKELVEKHFAAIGATEVERYELPQLSAINFVLHNALNGGVTRSISLDIHGKTLSALMLELEI